jgi:hypothetical protein
LTGMPVATPAFSAAVGPVISIVPRRRRSARRRWRDWPCSAMRPANTGSRRLMISSSTRCLVPTLLCQAFGHIRCAGGTTILRASSLAAIF